MHAAAASAMRTIEPSENSDLSQERSDMASYTVMRR